MNIFKSTDLVLDLEGGSRWPISLNFRASVSSSDPWLSWSKDIVVTLGKKCSRTVFSITVCLQTAYLRPLKWSMYTIATFMQIHESPSPLVQHLFFINVWRHKIFSWRFNRKKNPNPLTYKQCASFLLCNLPACCVFTLLIFCPYIHSLLIFFPF